MRSLRPGGPWTVGIDANSFQFALCDEVLSDWAHEHASDHRASFNSPFAMRGGFEGWLQHFLVLLLV